MTTYKPAVEVRISVSLDSVKERLTRLAAVDDRTLSMTVPARSDIDAALALPTLGQRLRGLRRAHGVHGTRVARLFGVDHVTIYNIERGVRTRSTWIDPLCRLWGVSEAEVSRMGMITIPRDDEPLTERIRRWIRMQSTTLPEVAAMCGVPYHAAWQIATGRQTTSPHIATIERMMHGEAAGA